MFCQDVGIVGMEMEADMGDDILISIYTRMRVGLWKSFYG